MENAILARRLLIILLAATSFAMLLSSFVQTTPRPINRVHVGSAAPCFHPASSNCMPVATTL